MELLKPSPSQTLPKNWGKIRAKILSSYTETDPGAWGVIWAELLRPLSAHARGWQVEWDRHSQHAQWAMPHECTATKC